MSFYRHLLDATAAERADFLAIPVIAQACDRGVSRAAYVDYLSQAYHHVRHTCPLLALAASRCDDGQAGYREALFDYIAEERGHEAWILQDIADLGGDAAAVRDGQARLPCRLMVAYAYYAIEHVDPHAMLGMVHVLEGMSVALAGQAARAIAARVGTGEGGGGFRYLASHGGLDVEHVAFFETLVDGIDDAAARRAIVDTAGVVYRLYGDLFREVAARHRDEPDAA
ncbi:MAG: iron-containing redox enzyme family protein [Proteobacteria bacterium]|nr:iron-containing redox enzyme family protein [Pseudomonadota bacterium]MDA0952807.1 iron-containing redox enzyme family protein [Pseudomonadota bacterium]